MAIIWGGFVGTGVNRFRMGIEYTHVGVPTHQSQTHVSVSASIWINTVAAVRDASTTLVWSGSLGSGTTTAYINTTAYGTQKLYSFTEPVALNAATPTTVTQAASLTGVDAVGATLKAIVTVSTTIPAKPAAPPNPPAMPATLTAVRVSDRQTRLTVSAVSGATRYRYEVSDYTNGSTYVFVTNTTSAGVLLWNGGKVNSRYRWRVRAENSGGNSGWRYNTSDVYTTPTAPATPTVKRSGTSNVVSWVDRAPHNTQFRVRHSADGGAWSAPLTTQTSAATTWTHTSPSQSSTHRYQVALGTPDGIWSAWSPASASVDLSQKPDPPTPLSPVGGMFDIATGSVPFSWQHNSKDSSDQTQAEIRYRHVDGGFTTVPVSGATTTATLPITLEPGGYLWQVRNRGANASWSDWSAVASFTVGRAPSVDIAGPNGTVTTARPTLSWNFGDADGDDQVNALVEVLAVDSGSSVIWATNVTGASQSTDMNWPLPEGRYRLRVTATDSTGLTGTDTGLVFTVAYARPEPPILDVSWNRELLRADIATTAVNGLRVNRWNAFPNPSYETTPTQWGNPLPANSTFSVARDVPGAAWAGDTSLVVTRTLTGFGDIGVRVTSSSLSSGTRVSFAIMVAIPADHWAYFSSPRLRYGLLSSGSPTFSSTALGIEQVLDTSIEGMPYRWVRLFVEDLAFTGQTDAFEVVWGGTGMSGARYFVDAAFLNLGSTLGGDYFDRDTHPRSDMRYGSSAPSYTAWEAYPVPVEQDELGVEATVSARVERSVDGVNWDLVAQDILPTSEISDPIPPLNQMVWYRVWAISDDGAETVGEVVSVFTESLESVINYGPGLRNSLIFTCEMEMPSSLEGYSTSHILSGRSLPVNVYDLDHVAPVRVSVNATKLHTHVPDLEALFKEIMRQDVYWRDYQRRSFGATIGGVSVTPLYIHRPNQLEDENHPVASFQVSESDAIFVGGALGG